jgi:hypothetical protein
MFGNEVGSRCRGPLLGFVWRMCVACRVATGGGIHAKMTSGSELVGTGRDLLGHWTSRCTNAGGDRAGDRRRRDHQPLPRERVWATPEQVLAVAALATALAGPCAGLLVVTAAWTGARWG